MNQLCLRFLTDTQGKKYLSPKLPQTGLNEKTLAVEISDGDMYRVYPVFQQKAGMYGDYSEYMTRHGCACCSLTTVLAAFVEKYADLTPDGTVIIETSRIRRKGRWIASFSDKKYAGSYHTMILLGIDEDGQAVFTDSATRAWAGEQQRLKRAELSELVNYMFPQKNVQDTHLYFSRRKNTGGYILIWQKEMV